MKNKVTGFIVALFTMLAFHTIKAQPSVYNLLSCPVVVVASFYDAGGYCGDDGPYTISPGVTLTYNPPGACGAIVSHLATLSAINGNAVQPGAYQISDGTTFPGAVIPIPGPPTACGTGSSANFYSMGFTTDLYKVQ